MSKKKKILIGVICVVLVLLITAVVLILDRQSPEQGVGDVQSNSTGPAEETQTPTTSTGGSSQETTPPSEEPGTPPEDQPPSVVIPPEKDPETGEQMGISFPYTIPGYDISIEKMGPYSGIFVEDGSNANVENVAMLMVKNNSDFPVEYIRIRVLCGQEELLFDVSALPAGEKLVVQEKTGKTISEDKVTAASALVVRRADMEMSEGKVQVIDNGDNTLTVKNLSNKTIPTIRVFYKYYMEDGNLFVGREVINLWSPPIWNVLYFNLS